MGAAEARGRAVRKPIESEFSGLPVDHDGADLLHLIAEGEYSSQRIVNTFPCGIRCVGRMSVCIVDETFTI